ncbi:alpha/beta hydrolase family protein [Solihabitans fulvus]|nr:hypothetical protein [Solihabitans fulvus]
MIPDETPANDLADATPPSPEPEACPPRTVVRKILRIAVRTLVVAVVLLLLGVVGLLGDAKIRSGEAVTLPAPTGPSPVGRAVFDWTDHSRVDPYAPQGSTPRELSVVVWYPAAPAPRATQTSYLPPGWQEALGDGGWLNALSRTPPSLIHPHAVADAPVDGAAPHPVLVFAPGMGLRATDYTVIAEDLASHGYVVAGVTPTYSTDVVLADGRVARRVDRAGDGGDVAANVQLWADDLRFTVTQLAAVNDTADSPFHGRLDTKSVGLFGHSLGGAAATLACHHESACVGAVDIDGYLFGDVLNDGLGKPFGFLGNQDSMAKDAPQRGMLRQTLRGVAAGQGHVWTVAGASHYNFTDRGVYFNLLRSQVAHLGPIDGARASAITNAYTRAFFDAYLRGRPAPPLTGESSTYPEVRQESP